MANYETSARARIGSKRLPMLLGYASLAVLIGVIGVWSVQTKISGAVIASGLIQVENNRQVLQHPQGGVVGELIARDGDRVAAGDVVLRLDDRLLRTEITISESQLTEIRARSARLTAERDDLDRPEFDAALLELARTRPDVAKLIEGQQRLFDVRRETLTQETSQLAEQAAQIEAQIGGVTAQLDATIEQADLVGQELADVQSLFDRGLTQASRVATLRRETARLRGEVGQLRSSIAQLEGDIVARDIEKLRLASTRREQAISQLRDLSVQDRELTQRLLALGDQLSKMEVRTPVSGVIYGSRVFATQMVISPAEPMMYVIPQDQPLIVSAKVEAIHIDQVHEGQEAALRFTAFDQRTTPEIFGVVTRLSADAFTDEVTGATYYQAQLIPRAEELEKLGDQVIVPGMPVEAFIRTAERTPLSYLLNPLSGYFYRAFRES